MCDHNNKNDTNDKNNINDNKNKGDEDMGITMPRPMEHEFMSKEEEKDFVKWTNGKNPTSEKIINQIKHDLQKHREMKKRLDERKY